MTQPTHILVTGGAGFIGSHLVERLLNENHRVTVVDDLSTGSLKNLSASEHHPNLTFIESKLSGCAQLQDMAASAQFIYHLAAAVGVDLVVNSPIHTIRNNLHETEILLEAADKEHTPVLLASTSEVYGKSQMPAFAETDDLHIGPPYLGRWGYACSKLMDEFMALAYVKERQLPLVIARFFNTVGPRQTGRYGMVLPRFIQAARTGQPLRVFGDGLQTRCFCMVFDTIEALIRLQNCPAARGEIFNIGSTEEISILDLAHKVIETLGSSSTIEHISYDQAYDVGFEDMRRRKPVVDKLFNATGFRPQTSLLDIIRLTAKS